MEKSRHKNVQWIFDESPTWAQVHVAVLMDIRDELQQLNRTLACPNTQAIPRYLREIICNTTKKKRRVKPK